jgi:rod shape-determining protein MreC
LYREAKVISNEISGIFNTIGLHRGSLQGLRKDMGVVDINGHVVGKIVEVSDNYAVAMSLLNKNSITSAKLKNGGDLGSVVWDAKDPGLLTLNDIKQSAKVNKGDTVFTSNYSEFFPYGLIIGTIADVKPDKGSNNYLIHLKPAVNFSTLQYGYAIDNLQKEEFIKLMDKVKSKDN